MLNPVQWWRQRRLETRQREMVEYGTELTARGYSPETATRIAFARSAGVEVPLPPLPAPPPEPPSLDDLPPHLRERVLRQRAAYKASGRLDDNGWPHR
jgi:hypothetical protein